MYKEVPTLVELLEVRASKAPENRAYTFLLDGESLEKPVTYQELSNRAKAIASKLQSLNLKGQRAILVYGNEQEFVEAFFASLYAGVIPVPVYPPMKESAINNILSIMTVTETNLILTSSDTAAKMKAFIPEEFLKMLNYFETDLIETSNSTAWTNYNLTREDLAFLQFTSGSTSTPKGVMVSHKNILHNEEMIKQSFRHSDKSMGVGWLPLYHDMGLIGNVLQPLYAGFECVLMSPFMFLQNPLRWLKAISKYKATSSGGPNFGYELCLRKIKEEDLKDLDLSSWNVAYSGSEPVKLETIDKFCNKFQAAKFNRTAFLPVYGMAETTLFVSGGNAPIVPNHITVNANELEDGNIVLVEDAKDEVKTKNLVSCGKSYLDQKIAIVNPNTLTRAKENQIGEIWLSGDNICNGYWNNPQQTEESFKAYLKDTNEGPFLRTGDLGFVLKDELFITGRQKDLIIIRGKNFYPQDIEAIVEKASPAIRKGCLAAFSVENAGEEEIIVVSELSKEHSENPELQEIGVTIARAILEELNVNLSELVFLETKSIPKTSSGKVQRSLCKRSYQKNKLNALGSYKKKMKF